MGKVYSELDTRLGEFIAEQHLFFVASAPLHGDGLLNVSPKGMDSFRILDPKTVAYLDYLGSGIESVAHIKENGRFVIMFCSFTKTPLIVRLYGQATVVERSDTEWDDLLAHFTPSRMARSIIKLSLERISDSCGWGVPMFEYVGERSQYWDYDAKTDDDGVRALQTRCNMKSIDGLPGLSKTTL